MDGKNFGGYSSDDDEGCVSAWRAAEWCPCPCVVEVEVEEILESDESVDRVLFRVDEEARPVAYVAEGGNVRTEDTDVLRSSPPRRAGGAGG